ncbi:adenosine receptor A2a-like [Pangasianodon hypophthalmus]|uniref:adenosine receptor A2a-like n=1 Tax=Pangasianodon hypophthalmus TaxID=310915 RepID=UPI00147A5E92|nr:adenosine receptor A2a-like [Pangasianodon hypophthalmus]
MNSCLGVTLNGSTQTVIPRKQEFFHVPYIAAEVTISILSTSGNLLVCIAVGRNKKLQTVTNYFLVSLAAADFFVGTLAIPCAIMTDLGLPHNNLYLCTTIVYMLITLTQSSVFSLLAIAIERYVAILLPFHYQRLLKPRNARLVILLTWFLAFLLSTVPLLGFQKRSSQINYCFFSCVVDIALMVYFNFFGCALIPLLAMFFIYVHIFLTVRRQVRRIAALRCALETQARQNSAMRREAKKATSILLLIFLFVLCWMPMHIMNCLQQFCPQCSVPVPLILTAIILSHANSAINPVLYAYKMKSFRQAFKDMFLCCRVTPPLSDTTDSNGTSKKPQV